MASFPNPVPIPFPADSDITITSLSNAAYFQRVIITDQNNARLATFIGTGEGVQMKTETGSDNYSSATRQTRSLSALFEFSAAGPGGPFQQATVAVNTTATVPSGTIQTIGTEDGADQDNNDTWMTVSVRTL